MPRIGRAYPPALSVQLSVTATFAQAPQLALFARVATV